MTGDRLDGRTCPVCGADRWDEAMTGVVDYLSGRDYAIDRCRTCGLLATVAPEDTATEEAYGPRYRVNRHGVTGRFRTARRVAAIRRMFPAPFRGRLLDLGCGDGSFALAMQASGWDVTATELDVDRLQSLRRHGIATMATDEFVAGTPARFDAIT